MVAGDMDSVSSNVRLQMLLGDNSGSGSSESSDGEGNEESRVDLQPPQVIQWGHHKRGSDSASDLSLPRNWKSSPADPHVSDVNSVSMIANDSTADPVVDLIAASNSSSVSPMGAHKHTSSSTHLFDSILSTLSFSKSRDPAGDAANKEFHSLFKLIPREHQLLESFLCSLNRSTLYEGTLYVTSHHVCFNSAMLDWVAQIQIPLQDIIAVTKGVDEICVTTSLGATRFTQFQKLDETFTFLNELVAGSQGEINHDTLKAASPPTKGSDILNYSVGLNPPLTQKSAVMAGATPSGLAKSKSSIKLLTMLDAKTGMTNEEAMDHMIRSIDDSTMDSSGESISMGDDTETKNVRVPIYKMSADSPNASDISYDGPYCNDARLTKNIPTRSADEYVLADIELSGAPGLIFQILFNETKPTFLHQFLSKQDSSHFTDIGAFELNADGVNAREYSYQKQLHFPVGPSTTLCKVEESILHYDLNDYIELVNTTRTPNVPSGGNFSTKTRYIIQWHENTRCKLKLSFWVEWTGSSWIKNMVESSCKTGLVTSTVDFVNLIEEFIEENTEEEYITIEETGGKRSSGKGSTPMPNATTPENRTESRNSQTGSETAVPSVATATSPFASASPLVVGLLISNIVLFLFLIYVVYSLDRKVRMLLYIQGYGNDKVAQTTGGLYEMPVKGDIAPVPSHEMYRTLMESLKSIFGPLAEMNHHPANSESPRDLLQKLLNILELQDAQK